eukprot:scaffold8995_cov41-Attheya_sp.AAC.1
MTTVSEGGVPISSPVSEGGSHLGHTWTLCLFHQQPLEYNLIPPALGIPREVMTHARQCCCPVVIQDLVSCHLLAEATQGL